ncbi:MAG: translation initiation factor IF-2 subunit alpha [Methanobacteriota archaeon]|nr:MAG: translation initiation factor IF-2 subunit alpha [Euryarchaeota archaeon]
MPRGLDFPEVGELVVCTVADVKNFGAFVGLDEYPTEKGRQKLVLRAKNPDKADDIKFEAGDFREGFIHITEVAPGWIKYIRDYVREGQKAVCKVLKVDEQKGHIDLSLKAVNEHQKREKIQEFKNEQKADKLMEFVSVKLGRSEDECWDQFGYVLVDKFGSLYAAFEAAVVDEKAIEKIGAGADWVPAFLAVARENIAPPWVDIDGYLEVTCPKPDGAKHIRDALVKVQKNEKVSVKVQYIGAPRYRLLVRANDYKTAEEEIQKAAQRVIKAVESHGGEGKFIRKE